MKYSIEGGNLPVVICELENGEKMITESGAMAWMSANMKMETNTGGGIGKLIGRAFSGENLFLNNYTAENGNGMIAFTTSFPGSILAFNIAPGQEIIAQKNAFLASEAGVGLSAHIQQSLGSGFFGGEGFIMQKLSGQGVAFLEFDGSIKEYELQAGQKLVLDTGYLAAMTESCTMEVVTVPGIKNMILGGEGIFNTVVTGPGKIWLQTMPIYQTANSLRPFFSSSR